MIRTRAVLVAIGIDWEGRRPILAVEIAGRESTTSWRELLLSLKQRGLSGVRLAISDDHAGLKRALAEVLPEAAWQRCYVHFLRTGYGWIYQRLFSHTSIWYRRPEDWRSVAPYLAMSYLYKRSNRFWHLLIKHNLVHTVWHPLVEWTWRRHLKFRARLAADTAPALVDFVRSGSVVSAGV